MEFQVHIITGFMLGCIFCLLIERHRLKLIFSSMLAAIIPDIDVLLGGFDQIDIDTNEYTKQLITNETIRVRISETLNNGLVSNFVKIEHRGITHSFELLFLVLILSIIISWVVYVRHRNKSRITLVFVSTIVLAWLSHLFLDGLLL